MTRVIWKSFENEDTQDLVVLIIKIHNSLTN